MNNIFFTADHHFGHTNILKHCERPFKDIEEADEALISNWNNTVDKKDLTYILGDFAWKNHLKYLNRLNGKKILIKGNHDKASHAVYRNFTEVCELKLITLEKQMVFLCHYPFRTWRNSIHGSALLYGHVHGRMKTFNLSIDVGVDTELANFTPISWETIKQEIERRKEEMVKQDRVEIGGINKVRYFQDDVRWLVNKLENLTEKDYQDKKYFKSDEQLDKDIKSVAEKNADGLLSAFK